MLNLYRLLLSALTSALLCTPVLGQATQPAAEAAKTGSGQDLVYTSPADIERALNAIVPEVQFNETPLEQALKTLKDLAKLNMLVDWSDLTGNGVDRDKAITLHLRDVPVNVVLMEVLRQAAPEDVSLGYRVRDGIVRVMSQAAARRAGVLVEIRYTNIPLSKVIEYLRSADPSFHVVVAGAPGASPDKFMISELDLRNVTASQVLEALKMAYPEINVSFTGDDPPVWTVRVVPMRGPSTDQVTSVFRLREAINQVQQDMEVGDRVKARAAVLQLLEQAVRMSDTEEAPVLQLHEATDTLLFRGNSDQMMTLRNALKALVSPQPEMFQTTPKESKPPARPPT